MNISKFLFKDLLELNPLINSKEENQPSQETKTSIEVKQEISLQNTEILTENKITQEELSLAKTDSFNEGYNKACLEFAEKKLSNDEQIVEILKKITLQLALTASDQNKLLEEIKNDSFEIAVKIISKIHGEISEDTSTIIINMIQKYINLLAEELLVNIVLHPDTKLLIANKIQDILLSSSLQHKFFILESHSIAKSDCIIQWEGGAVEFNKKKLLDKIINNILN